MVSLTPWVTPGRVQNPHLEWDSATNTINPVNVSPYNYGALATTSQAYQNINVGIPTTYNQYSGCPAGHIMGSDGVCRLDPNWIGAGTTTGTTTGTTATTTGTTADTTAEAFQTANIYQGGGQPDADPDVGTAGQWTGNVTGNTYANLKGGWNNWSDETFYDYGLDKGYFTEDGGLVGAMEAKLPGWMGTLGQWANDKKFNAWLSDAQKKGIFKLSYDTEGNLEDAWLMKKRGPLDNEWGGGMLEDIAKKTKSEQIWNEIITPKISVEFGGTTIPYDYKTREIEKSYKTEDVLENKNDDWWFNTFNAWLDGKHDYTDEDRYDNTYPDALNVIAQDVDLPNPDALGLYPSGRQIQPDYFSKTGGGVQIFKNEMLRNSRLFDRDVGAFTTITQQFDPLLHSYDTEGRLEQKGKWVDFDPGLDAEGRRRARSKKLLAEMEAAKKPTIQELKKPSLLIGTVEGNKASNMVIASQGQYVGASVYKSPDKATPIGGHYQQNGKFVNSDGQVSARGSMSDSIYAMANGTAVDSVLDRTLKNSGSIRVMKEEAEKMFKAGKITEDEKNKVISYKSKSDYQKDENNKTIHENGSITKGSEKKFKKEVKGTTKPGTSGGYQHASGGSSGGNTGSESKKDKKIICTEMYRQTNLNDWKEAMKLWYLFQKKYLTSTHQVGYHFLFKPFVKGMKKSKILTAIGSHFAKQRTKDIKHIMFGTKFSLLGRIYRIIFEPICYTTGLLLTYKEKRAWQ